MIDQEEKERLKDKLKDLINESNELNGMLNILYYVIENTYIKKRFLKNVEDRMKVVRERYNLVSLEIQSIYNELIPNKPIISKEFIEEHVKNAKIKYGSNK